MTNRFKLLVLMAAMAFVLWLSSSPIDAEGNNLGLLISTEGAHEGYTLFSPILSTDTFLIDSDGKVVHSWASDFRTLPVYLLENGNLLRSAVLGPEANPVFLGGGVTGRVEVIAWDGTVVWEFEYSDDTHSLHHDVERLPNGNVLMIAWERKTAAEAIAAGRDPAKLTDDDLWPNQIIEVQPTGASGGDIVWEWNAWDHLVQDFDSEKANFGVVADHPELIDLNFILLAGHDWHHANGIDYNAELDQIILSVRTFSEFWVIDHSTTTEEAAGHTGGNSGKGGDLLYRWGNPQAYGAGDDTDQTLFTQHDAQWIDNGLPGEGNILVFNNGLFRLDGSYSSIDEIVPPVDSFGNYSLDAGQAYGPESPVWTYMAEEPADFFSALISGVQRLPNGNTLIDEGNSGNFFEVTPDGQTVWRYVNPVTGDGPLPQGGTIPIFNTFGPRMQINDGRAIPNFFRQAILGERLTLFGDGSQTRSFMYVDDLVEGVWRLLRSSYIGPVNIGNPSEMTLRAMAEKVIEITGSASPIEMMPLPPDDPKVRRPDITLAQKVLDGWEPKISVE
ncbi:MAG: aryl-sulfate sulfotransferase, partial [Chloroflexi bacterium]|nr:aryl-sulfate sulfotransferase [Chloroflexota bacterium]